MGPVQQIEILHFHLAQMIKEPCLNLSYSPPTECWSACTHAVLFVSICECIIFHGQNQIFGCLLTFCFLWFLVFGCKHLGPFSGCLMNELTKWRAEWTFTLCALTLSLSLLIFCSFFLFLEALVCALIFKNYQYEHCYMQFLE